MTDAGYQRTLLMGDPTHFSVKGGANPHTRNRFGMRRSVDKSLAVRQWHQLRDTLSDLGARVIVVPPDPAQPGLVYPANAGFMSDVDARIPLQDKVFTLSNLLPTRAGEKALYRRCLEAIGIPLSEIDEFFRFEGEADFFPAGGDYLLTCGRLETQRFVPHWGMPPWKRVYGFRTDARIEPILAKAVPKHEIYQLELVLEAHYHGDTALCAFGKTREFLLAYRRGLTTQGFSTLRELFGERLIEIDDADAGRYAANSYSYSDGTEPVLVMPDGLSDRLLGQIRERGVQPMTVDVSEFLKKGGGSVKCMIGDLGPIRANDLAKLPDN